MIQGSEPVGRRAVVAALWVTAALNVAYWVLFFSTGAVQTSREPCYLAFEGAFPAADGWLAVLCVICARQLQARRPGAVVSGIAAGSAFVYLGLMDTLYDLEHNLYASIGPEMLGEIGICLTCFLFGPFLMSYVWSHRRWLGA